MAGLLKETGGEGWSLEEHFFAASSPVRKPESPETGIAPTPGGQGARIMAKSLVRLAAAASGGVESPVKKKEREAVETPSKKGRGSEKVLDEGEEDEAEGEGEAEMASERPLPPPKIAVPIAKGIRKRKFERRGREKRKVSEGDRSPSPSPVFSSPVKPTIQVEGRLQMSQSDDDILLKSKSRKMRSDLKGAAGLDDRNVRPPNSGPGNGRRPPRRILQIQRGILGRRGTLSDGEEEGDSELSLSDEDLEPLRRKRTKWNTVEDREKFMRLATTQPGSKLVQTEAQKRELEWHELGKWQRKQKKREDEMIDGKIKAKSRRAATVSPRTMNYHDTVNQTVSMVTSTTATPSTFTSPLETSETPTPAPPTEIQVPASDPAPAPTDIETAWNELHSYSIPQTTTSSRRIRRTKSISSLNNRPSFSHPTPIKVGTVEQPTSLKNLPPFVIPPLLAQWRPNALTQPTPPSRECERDSDREGIVRESPGLEGQDMEVMGIATSTVTPRASSQVAGDSSQVVDDGEGGVDTAPTTGPTTPFARSVMKAPEAVMTPPLQPQPKFDLTEQKEGTGKKRKRTDDKAGEEEKNNENGIAHSPLRGFGELDESQGQLLSSMPEPEEVDMIGIVADVGAGTDEENIEEGSNLVEEVDETMAEPEDAAPEKVIPSVEEASKKNEKEKKDQVQEKKQEKETAPEVRPTKRARTSVLSRLTAPTAASKAKSAASQPPSKPAPKPRPTSALSNSRPASALSNSRPTSALSTSRKPITKPAPPSKTAPKATSKSTSSIKPPHPSQQTRRTTLNSSFSAPTPPPPSTTPTSLPTPATRVFARFRDQKLQYHPATVTSSLSPTTLLITFDDSTTDNVERTCVRSLDLRIGDNIRVDVDGMRGRAWIIRGFPETQSSDTHFTDIKGRSRVLVGPKRTSTVSSETLVKEELHEVEVTKIYLPQTLWGQFAARDNTDEHFLQLQLPVQDSRRASMSFESHRSSSLTPKLVSSTTSAAPAGEGVFSNMIFALSFAPDDAALKSKIQSKILANGGRLVDASFRELFLPASTALKTEFKGVKFVAVITPFHSRKTKYLEALALGIPCLAPRWVEDSIRHSTPVKWDNYLLPAGESSYLASTPTSPPVTKSRVIPHIALNPTESANFEEDFGKHEKILSGHRVLFVTPTHSSSKKSAAKKAGEDDGVVEFLVRSMVGENGEVKVIGSGEVESVVKKDGGKRWNLVVVKGDEGARKKVEKSLGGRGGGKGEGVRCWGQEEVVQSLILGGMVE